MLLLLFSAGAEFESNESPPLSASRPPGYVQEGGVGILIYFRKRYCTTGKKNLPKTNPAAESKLEERMLQGAIKKIYTARNNALSQARPSRKTLGKNIHKTCISLTIKPHNNTNRSSNKSCSTHYLFKHIKSVNVQYQLVIRSITDCQKVTHANDQTTPQTLLDPQYLLKKTEFASVSVFFQTIDIFS